MHKIFAQTPVTPFFPRALLIGFKEGEAPQSPPIPPCAEATGFLGGFR